MVLWVEHLECMLSTTPLNISAVFIFARHSESLQPNFCYQESLTRFNDGRWCGWSCSWWFSSAYWVWVRKGRTHVSEQVYRLGRGPQQHKAVGFWGAGRLDHCPDFSWTTVCCDGSRRCRSCSWWFCSTAYGYEKWGHMWVNGSTDLEGVHGSIKLLDFDWVRRLDCPDFSWTTGCCDGNWRGRSCSRWISTAYHRQWKHCLWTNLLVHDTYFSSLLSCSIPNHLECLSL